MFFFCINYNWQTSQTLFLPGPFIKIMNLWVKLSLRNVICDLFPNMPLPAKSTIALLLGNALTSLCLRNIEILGWKTLSVLQMYLQYIFCNVFQPCAISKLMYYLILVPSFHTQSHMKIIWELYDDSDLFALNFCFLKFVDFF